MWNDERLLNRIEEFRADLRIQKMDEFIQHGRTTTLQHVIRVAALALWFNKVLRAGVNEDDLFLAAILHDYYLYDWHTFGDKLHGYHHPYIAAQNAARDFNASHAVQRMIETHMWPLNIRDIPRSRGAWILTLSDKVISTQETVAGFFVARNRLAEG